jgi:hypothetical protein
MTQRTFLLFIGWLFLLKVVAFLAVWLFGGWTATLAGWEMPSWVAAVGVVVDAFISWWALRFSRRQGT